MGTVTKQGSQSKHPSSYDTSNYSYASISSSYPIANAYTDSSSTTYCQVNWKTGSNAESYVYLRFNFDSIPSGATIKSVTAKAKGYVNTTNSSRVTSRQMQLCTGTTLKGSALTMSNSTSEQTFSSVGSWTVNEIANAGIRYYVQRGTSNTSSNYNFRMYGATMTVTYEWQETTYTVSVSNSTSATVTADPTTVIAGQSCLISSDTISGITIKDNGTDVTNQFTLQQDTTGEYTVTNRGDYGFELNNGYYVSQNKGISKTAAVCRINFSVPVTSTVTFTYINYAEASYDFGVFGNLDTELSTSYYAAGSNGATITDSSYKKACNTSSDNTSTAKTLTYSNVSAGDHYIDVKYSKDDASDANNDTLQFQVAITYNQTVTYYGYTISNISGDHTIVVAAASQGGIYIKVNGSWVGGTAVYKKVSGSWVLQNDLTQIFESGVNYKVSS